MFKSSTSEKLKQRALYTLIKLVLLIVAMIITVILMKTGVESKIVNVIVLVMILVTMIPAFSLPTYSFVLAIGILIKGMLNKNQEFEDYGKEILIRCFGWKKPEVGLLYRIGLKIPIVGHKVEKIIKNRETNDAKDYFLRIVLYFVLIFVSWKIFTSLMMPIMIKYTTGESKMEILINYLKLLYHSVF